MLEKDDTIAYWPHYDITLDLELNEAVMTVTVEINVIPIDMYY
jgi:hypothetical protein